MFSLVWIAFSWILTVQAYRLEIFDRYYFPVVLCLSILIPLLWDRPVPAAVDAPWAYTTAAVCTVALGWFSIAGLHDHFRWNDARWNLVRYAFSSGVSPANLAGGFEVNGWENYDDFQAHHGLMSLNCRVNYDDWFCLDDDVSDCHESDSRLRAVEGRTAFILAGARPLGAASAYVL